MEGSTQEENRIMGMNRAEMESRLAESKAAYEAWKEKGLKLDLSRGKPGKDQLELSSGLLDVLNSSSDMHAEDGTDTRNYGVLEGLPEAKRLMASLIGTDPANVMVLDSVSLPLMYRMVELGMIDGLSGCEPMLQQKDRKWLCPAPGYDRHFGITQRFGFELITIPMREDGPDMEMVRKYVENDPAVKGIWCVPKFANPTGVVYSDEVVKAFAALNPAAADFRIYWDNAYCVHDLYDEFKPFPDILSLCAEAGHPDMVYEFCSTSKIAFPGSGMGAVAMSPANKANLIKALKYETIGPDKVSQLRLTRFFKDREHVLEHMKKHAAILRPKFETVEKILAEELGGLDIASWTLPRGGYFISLNVLPGCAKEVVRLAKAAGVNFTGAGATYPYGKDPEDSNLRIAPSFAAVDEIGTATEILAQCVKIACLTKLLEA